MLHLYPLPIFSLSLSTTLTFCFPFFTWPPKTRPIIELPVSPPSTNVQTTPNIPHPIPHCEVKRSWGDWVLWWVTTWETSTDVCIFFSWVRIAVWSCVFLFCLFCVSFLSILEYCPWSTPLCFIYHRYEPPPLLSPVQDTTIPVKNRLTLTFQSGGKKPARAHIRCENWQISGLLRSQMTAVSVIMSDSYRIVQYTLKLYKLVFINLDNWHSTRALSHCAHGVGVTKSAFLPASPTLKSQGGPTQTTITNI